MKVAGYCRVSRDDLHNENQEKIIKEFCLKNGWEVDIYKEVMTTRKTRPIKNELLNKLRKGEYDILIFVRIDRWARSLVELVMDLDFLINRGIRVISIQNGFDFSKNDYNSTNRFILQVMGAFAEMERELIRERTLEGLARARAWGKKLGRPRKNNGSAGCEAIKKTPPENFNMSVEEKKN